MTEDPLAFVFELQDNVSGPAAHVADGLDHIASSFDVARRAAEGFEKAAGRARDASGRFVSSGGGGGGPRLPTGGGAAGGDGGGIFGLFEEIGKLGGEFGEVAGALGPAVVAVGAFAAAATAAAAGIAVAAFKIGAAVVDVATDKQNTRIGLSTLLGSDDEGRRGMRSIQDFADTTPFQMLDVARPVKGLVGSGYSLDKAMELTRGLGDVASLNGMNPEVMSRLALSLQKVEGRDKFQQGALTSLNRNSGGLISDKDVLAQLAESTGKSRKVLEKEMKAGTISAEQGTDAIIAAIKKKFNEDELGETMQKFGREIPGLFSTLKDIWTQSIVPDVDDSDGLKHFRGFMRSMLDATQAEKPALMSAADDLINATFGGVFGELKDGDYDQFFKDLFRDIADGAHMMADFVRAAAEEFDTFVLGVLIGLKIMEPAFDSMVDSMADAFRDENGDQQATADMFFDMAVSVGKLAGALATAAVAAADLFGYVAQYKQVIGGALQFGAELTGVGETFDGLETGANLVRGIAEGMRSAKGEVVDAAGEVVEAADGAVRDEAEIHSPSRLFAEHGEFMGEGVAVGLESMRGRVRDAAAGLVPDPSGTLDAPGDGGAAGGGDTVINITIGDVIVQGAGDAEGTAESLHTTLGTRLADEVRRAVLRRGGR